MDDLIQEECEDNTLDEANFRRNRCRVQIDVRRGTGQVARAEEAIVNAPEQRSLADTSTENTNRVTISPRGIDQEANENDDLRLTSVVEPAGEATSTLTESFTETSGEDNILSVVNRPCVVQNGPPPSYTSLPPTITGLPPMFHSPPPPSYEETFGLRYLDRDQPVIVFNTENMWGYRPQLAYCRSCNAMVLTTVQSQYCQATHLTAILSFFFCCWPCCVLPYFIPALKEALHHCPACNSYLGTYHPFTRTV